MSLLNELPPRHFADITVPLRAGGTPLFATETDEDFDTYLAWLAEHLYTAEIPLHPRQLAYAEQTDAEVPSTAAFWISEIAGHTVLELDSINSWFELDTNWEEYHAHHRKVYEEFSEDERAEWPFEEWAVNDTTWLKLREEWLEEQEIDELPSHADIPYRALLSRILKRVPDFNERVRILDSFFFNLTENASK